VGTTTIQGLTFTGGSTGGPGGAIRIDGTSAPQILDNDFRNNSANSQGGAVFINVGPMAGTTTVSGNQFGTVAEPNRSTNSQGGGLFLEVSQAPTVVSGNHFVGNEVVNGLGGGAAVFPLGNGAALTVSDNTFQANTVTSGFDGGGMLIAAFSSAPITLSHNNFVENKISASGTNNRHGAGLALVNNVLTGATPTVTQANNSFDENLITTSGGGEAGGAGEWIAGLSVTSTNDSFTSNTIEHANAEGGGVGVEGEKPGMTFIPGELHATNLVADGNRLGAGGKGAGVYVGIFDTCPVADCPSVVELNDSTVAGNCVDAGVGGGSPGIAGSGLDTLTLRNSIVYNAQATLICGTPPVVADVDGFTAPNMTATFSDLCVGVGGAGGPVTGAGNICADPLLNDPHFGGFHQVPGSPTIDAGSNALVPAGVTTDLDLQPRISGAAVDMGADEVIVAPPPTAGDVTKPKFKLVQGVLTVDSHGRVKIKLSCVEDTRCIGTISLVTQKPLIAKRKAKKLKLGSKRFNVPGNKTSTVTLKLSKKARKLLARKHSLKVVETVSGKDTAGNAAKAKRTVTLKRAKPKHHQRH
jgi:hypothetical protein